MRDNAVDTCLPALKLAPDWFVTHKMLEKRDNVIFFNDDKDFDEIDSVDDIVTFFSDGVVLVTIDLNYVKFDDNNFD